MHVKQPRAIVKNKNIVFNVYCDNGYGNYYLFTNNLIWISQKYLWTSAISFVKMWWLSHVLLPFSTLKAKNSMTLRQGIYGLKDLLHTHKFYSRSCTVFSLLVKTRHYRHDLKQWKEHRRI